MMSRLNARIDADNHIEKKSTKALTWTKRVALVSTAAAIAALAYIGFLGGNNGPAADSRNFIAYRNNSEDISAVMLDDSTKVWLGKNSSMEYDVDCEEIDRVVKLQGEAYFDVHSDTSHPFIVHAGNLAVRVLGTAFCVNSNSETGKISVILERGSVRLQTPEGLNLVRLAPDQKAEFDTASGDISVESINATPYVIQHYNKITLSSATITDIVTHINTMYGVKVQITSEADTTRKYNLNYKRTDPLPQVLDIVKELTGTQLEINN